MSIPQINATYGDWQVDHQESVVEVEGKIHKHFVSILIDPRYNLIYFA